MGNSNLVGYTKISPNKTSPRKSKIDTITIHCYTGNVSLESMGEWFGKASTKASSNYGIDSDGHVGMFVEEKDRSWCSSNGENDNRAITIEIANLAGNDYPISDKAYSKLILLLVDICKRNKMDALRWKNDKKLIGQVDKQNMTVHRWFANKECPGEYIFKLLPTIAYDVNQLLENKKAPIYRVQLGAFMKKENADIFLKQVQTNYPEAFIQKGE